ncbi:uncharacterized protein LOC100880148 [Megachile rotundata]|uniref:uncharacterized protein LOC100880148 n=1 Tax=Megachile rotundata TaxID=143995 RepID=UPI003FD2460E
MPNFQQQYKGRRFGFGNTEESRLIRAEKREELRKEQRAGAFNVNRNITNSTNASGSTEMQLTVGEDRLTRLKRWKEERERRKKIEQIKKKPPFKVGVVHHKIYSPVTSDQPVTSITTHEKARNQTAAAVPKRITRATEKRLMRKAVSKETPNQITKTVKPLNQEEKNKKKQRQSFAPVDHKFKAPTGLPNIPLFGRVAIQSMSPSKACEVFSLSTSMPETSRRCSTTKFVVEDIDNEKHSEEENEKDNVSEKDREDSDDSSIEPVLLKLSDDETFTCPNKDNSHDNDNVNNLIEENNSIYNNTIETLSPSKNNLIASTPYDSENVPVFLPYVVSSRGKINARKEEQIRRGFSFSHSRDDDIPTKDTIKKCLNISVEEEKRTAQYFQFLLNREIDRLNELCTKWTDIKEDVTTTEDGQYEINQAIGQTNLLISKKFERFRGLVADCETGKGEMLVTCKDLQGFWDMMYMEVKNCDTRFEKLEKLRSRNWVEEQTPATKIVPKNKSKVTTRKKPVTTKPSSIKTFLTEKRKNLTQQVKNNDNMEKSKTLNNQGSNIISQSNTNSPSIKDKIRRSTMSFQSTKSTPIKQSKTRLSLLQQTQLPTVSKYITTPLTMMKVSQLGKTPDVQLDSTISYINSDQKPRKSILKTPNLSRIASAKSTSKVNFNDHNIVLNEEPVDEETQIKMDLGAALARIDSFNFDNADDVVVNAEKKLNFDDDSSEASDDVTLRNSVLIKITDNTPLKHSNGIISSPRKRLVRQNAIDEDDTKLDEINVTLDKNDIKLDKSDMKLDTSDIKLDKSDINIDNSDTLSAENIMLNVTIDKVVDDTISHVQEDVTIHDEKEINMHNESIKVLRNRVITAVDTPKSRRSLKKLSGIQQESEQKENKTPVMNTRRRTTVKISTASKDEEDLEKSLNKVSLNETSEKRKSRRSVKFSESDASGSVPSKSALPMTPHIRRSKAKSSEKQNADLISWETPDKLPDRVRRSRSRKSESRI